MLNDDVFWFDVSMNNSIAMNVGDCFEQVIQHLQYLAFGELLVLFDDLVKVAAWAVFHDEIDVVSVVKQPE